MSSTASSLGTPSNPVKYLNQDFEALKARCLASDTLFEDETFPPNSSSLGASYGVDSVKAKGVVWKRPAEITPNPRFIIDGATRQDIRQGALGDCWFLSSIASLTQNKDFMSLVVPDNQSFQTDYAGIFLFKFWQYGEWVEVVVDDRLPTKSGKLVFLKSLDNEEFWSALLEKAYAKVNGSYEALNGGLPVEALEDFTGGTAEIYELQDAPNTFFQTIQKRLKAKALLTCTSVSWSSSHFIIADYNVITYHAYSINGAEEVSYHTGKVQLIRVRNPWGYKEWNGAWSDNAPEWDEIDPEVKAALNVKCDDGEVWIPFPDFVKVYGRTEVCNVNLSSALNTEDQKWCVTQFNGSWKKGVTAGGGKDNSDTFWTNPQFWITLENPDIDHKGSTTDPCCRIIVSLMQKDRRKKKTVGAILYAIGYYIYQSTRVKGIKVNSAEYKITLHADDFLLSLKSPESSVLEVLYLIRRFGSFSKYKIPKELQNPKVQIGRDYFMKNSEIARNVPYTDHREISCRFKLPVGLYVIVPHTRDSNLEADFFLRVFTERKAGAL
ncbi:calpain-8-like [Pelodytes ibericus]